MARPSILITGSSGEVGHSLVDHFIKEDKYRVIGVNIQEVHVPQEAPKDFLPIRGDITDKALIDQLFAENEIHEIFHLAGVLSSGGEKNPERTHEVNVNGSVNLLSAAKIHGQKLGRSIKFLFPSTIAVYGISNLTEKNSAGKVSEGQFLSPITMYGCNKLYVEHLGRYYSRHYKLLDNNPSDVKLDFRAVRFPGLMSADTLPTGGTSDYGSEMIHAAAQSKPYECFVSPEATLPFMTMPDGIRALIELAQAPQSSLTQTVYNVGAFSLTAKEIEGELSKYFPEISVSYKPHLMREQIVNTWPAIVDDSVARRDWGWEHSHGREEAFGSYLVPRITNRYR